MKNLFYIVLMISTLIFLQACSEDEEVATTTVASQTMTDSTGATVNLDGTYLVACNGSSSGYQTEQIVLSGNTYTYTYNGFSDSTCATAEYSATASATYTMGDNATTTTTDNATAVTEVNLALQSQDITLKAASYVTSWNADSAGYGFTDWVSGTAKSILGLNWDGTTSTTFVVGQAQYDIFYISGTSLQTGTCDDCWTTTYPTDLSSSIYVKQ